MIINGTVHAGQQQHKLTFTITTTFYHHCMSSEWVCEQWQRQKMFALDDNVDFYVVRIWCMVTNVPVNIWRQ